MKKYLEVFTEKRLQLLIVLILLLSALAFGLVTWSSNTFDVERYDEIIASAEAAKFEKSYSKSLTYYLEAVELAPRQYEGYSGLVMVLSIKTRFDDAKDIVDGAFTSLDPEEYSNLWATLGDGYAEAGRFYKAFESYEQSYKYDKSDFKAAKVVESAIISDNLDAAQVYYEKLSKPEDHMVSTVWAKYTENMSEEAELYDIAIASQGFINNGYPALAVSLLENRSEDIESYWEGMYYLGRARFDLGDYKESIVAFEDAVILGSDNYQLFLYLARANNELSEKNTAYKYFALAIEFASEEEAHLLVDEYVDVLLEDEQFIKAEELLDEFSDKNWALLNYMELYYAQKDWDAFLEDSNKYSLTESESAQEDNLDYRELLLDYYFEKEDLENARLNLDKYTLHSDDDAQQYLYEGRSALLDGNSTEAKKFFNMAIDADTKGGVTVEADRYLANM